MNTVPRLMLIVCVAVFFSSNASASDYFFVVNNTHGDITVMTRGGGYCMNSVWPSKHTIVPGAYQAFTVDYSSSIRGSCDLHHSSQDFTIIYTLNKHTRHSISMTWYKPVFKHEHVILPKIPDHEPIKLTLSKRAFGAIIGPTLTFSERGRQSAK